MRRSLAVVFLLVLVASCGDGGPTSVGDSSSSDPASWFEGDFDGEQIVLQRTGAEVPGSRAVPVDLVASRLVFDPATRVLEVVVHVRNASSATLYAPARVGLSDFVPDSVLPQNADALDDLAQRWWYDYTEALPADGLAPGERSDGVRWSVLLPDAGSFSFAALAQFSAAPDRPVLGGKIFLDLDRDGEPDPEEPASFGEVGVTFPDGHHLVVRPGEDGRWSVPVRAAGLYHARWIAPPTFGFAPVCLTTPSPLQILLTPGPSGLPLSFRSAHFGVDPEPCFAPFGMPILLSDAPLDSIRSAPWSLVDAVYVPASDGARERLDLSVGFSGCQPDHPLVFAIQRPGPDGDLSRIDATVIHDDLGELCDAWFEVSRSVDLPRLRRLWADATGHSGPLTLLIHAPEGVREVPLD